MESTKRTLRVVSAVRDTRAAPSSSLRSHTTRAEQHVKNQHRNADGTSATRGADDTVHRPQRAPHCVHIHAHTGHATTAHAQCGHSHTPPATSAVRTRTWTKISVTPERRLTRRRAQRRPHTTQQMCAHSNERGAAMCVGIDAGRWWSARTARHRTRVRDGVCQAPRDHSAHGRCERMARPPTRGRSTHCSS